MPGATEALNYKSLLHFQSDGKCRQMLHKFIYRYSFQPFGLFKQREDSLDALGRKARFCVGLEFFHK